jgi:nitrite reductase (NADH) large subunit
VSNNIIIIGGGIAAVSAIKAIREVESESTIQLFQDEKFYPYNRIKLTKSLFGKLEEKDILLQKIEWYETNKVEIHLNKKIIEINVEGQEIIASDGRRFKYDKLLLATGSTNFKPTIEGIDKKNVYTIRHLEDAWDLRNIITSDAIVMNIGGGIQGLETTWELNQQGKEVYVAEIQSRLMPRQLDERASEILKHVIESFNIKILLNTEIKKIIGSDNVEGILTNEGNIIDCSILVYSVGTRPNIDILEHTSVEKNKGVMVNNRMQTNLKNIYAAGDAAEFQGRVTGLWNIAIEQGKTAGYNIADKDTIYKDIVPVTTLNAFGISLFSMGNVDETQCDSNLIEDNLSNISYKRIFIRNNKVVGAIVIGDTKKSPLLKAAIEKQTPLNSFDIHNISVEDLLNNLKN